MNSMVHGVGRPVVGICSRTAPVSLQGLEMTVSLALNNHVSYLAAAGCTPLLLPLLPGVENLVDRIDGLLIPGGPDMDPALYGQTAHPNTRVIDPAADRVELGLIQAALTAKLPILAICRGMQLLNVQHGGTLHQHLPDTLGHDHHSPQTPTYTYGRQPLNLAPGSRVATIISNGEMTACHHHQAVDRLGTGLTATAWTSDGTIEAVEATHHPFALGVQWEAGQTSDQRFHQALAQAASLAHAVH